MANILIDIRDDGKCISLGQSTPTDTKYKGLILGKGTNNRRDIIFDLETTSGSDDKILSDLINSMG